jgi:hypothetical protein
MTLRRWAVPLSVAVVVAGVIVLAVRLAGGSSTSDVRSSAAPHMLHLASSGQQETAMAASSTAGGTAADVSGDPYTLTGTLPQGTPADQPLWRLRTANADDAQRVADALQLKGSLTAVRGGWAMRDGDNRLIVRDDGNWSYGMDCSPDTPVADEDVTVGCAVASSGVGVSSGGGVAVGAPSDGGSGTVSSPEPVPVPTPPPGPSDSAARAVARALFDRLGLDNPRVTVYSGDPSSTVQASPSVDGKQVSGWFTTVQVDGSDKVVSADGWITQPDRGADYPVISAQRAFDLLQQQPRPMMLLCAQRKDGEPGCADIPPTEITGATLGLMLDQDDNKPVLVPAWLFSVKGQGDPLTQIAVDPSYLAQPTPPSPEPVVSAEPPVTVEPQPATSEPASK